MPPRVETAFHDVVRQISACVARDYVSEQENILALMTDLARDKLALRYFLFKGWGDRRYRRLTSAQSFYVFGCKDFYFRMNMWYPKNRVLDAASARRLDNYFSIDSCHNHSVDFFTVGLLGPGYVTEFRDTDDDISEARIGDRIAFQRTWTDQLAEGRAFFVPKSSRFHTQYAPAGYSVSLNLVIWEPVICRQFTLAADKETVREVYDLRDAPELSRDVEWF